MSEDVLNAIHYEGEDEARQKLEKWLLKICDSQENEGGLEVEVFHYVPGEMRDADPIAVSPVDPELSHKDIASDVLKQCMEYCDDIETGKIRFQCKVQGIAGPCTFTITIPERDTGEDVDEGPTHKGIIMQQMRHNQFLLKSQVQVMNQAATMFQGAAAMLVKSNDDKDRRISELEQGYTSNLRVFEDLMSARHVRDLESKAMDNKERRYDAVAGILMQGAPLLLNKFLAGGKAKVFDEKRTSIELMLEGFLETFKSDQLEKITSSGIFTPEQMMGFMQLANAIIERQQAEREATDSARNGTPPKTP